MKVLNLKVLLGLLVMSFALTSCSDDDGGGGKSSGSIVGAWFDDDHSVFVFSPDGNGIRYSVRAQSVAELDGTYYGDKRPFTYSYDVSDKELIIWNTVADGSASYTTYYDIIDITSKELRIDDGYYDDPWVWYRIPDSKIPTRLVESRNKTKIY